MTENEAIEALADELIADEAVEQNEVVGEATQGEANEVAGEAKEPSNSELMAELQKIREANSQKDEPKSEVQEQASVGVNLANKEALDELGLGDLGAQLQENLNYVEQQKQALAEQQEQARLASVFEGNIKKFKDEYPTIKVEELYNFIKDNGYQDLLTEDYKSFKLIGNAMINLAKTGAKADDITPNGGVSTKKSAFDRLRENESVSDIELGAELLEL